MPDTSIYQLVKDKLATHGVENTADGRLILSDTQLFALFVDLERALRQGSFDAVLAVATSIERYVATIGKPQLMGFAYLYLRFSGLTPKRTDPDEPLPDGTIRKSFVFARDVTEEERLIGLWAAVKYDQMGPAMLRAVYRDADT